MRDVVPKIIAQSRPGGPTEVDRAYCLGRKGRGSGAISFSRDVRNQLAIPRCNISYNVSARACSRECFRIIGAGRRTARSRRRQRATRPPIVTCASTILRSRVSNRKSAQVPVPAIVFPNVSPRFSNRPIPTLNIQYLNSNLFKFLNPRLSLSKDTRDVDKIPSYCFQRSSNSFRYY